jgi:transposase-like protein
MGGKRRNMSNAKRKTLTGRGTVGKTAVAGIKDRASNQVQAKVVANTKSETMSRFIMEHVEPGAVIYTDDALTYHALPNHETVKHSVGEYVRGKAHTNGVESFWSMLKRSYTGTFHKISPKHLNRYVREFSGRHNIRESGTLDQMRDTVLRLVGRNLLYRELTADNGLDSGARS